MLAQSRAQPRGHDGAQLCIVAPVAVSATRASRRDMLPATTNPKMVSEVSSLTQRLERLQDQGVRMVDVRQIYVDEDVEPSRIFPGVVLHPGTRLHGSATLLCPGAEIGTEGPATVVDSALGAGAKVCSGFVSGSVLLSDAQAGAASHFRAGTLLEEQASTAHCVGLKQTILLGYVTLGSLINFCDVLMAGGTSRRDHSEVGSGFIHFNFTPWGERGDKATASLVGDVVRGVFLRQPRIFLGGSGGLVGPRNVGYGSLTAAGSVVRRDVPAGTLMMEASRRVARPFARGELDGVRRAGHNVAYIANLVALEHWYRRVRLPRAERARRPGEPALIRAAVELLSAARSERETRLADFLHERGKAAPRWSDVQGGECPLDVTRDVGLGHPLWVASLSDDEVAEGTEWLRAIVRAVVEQVDETLQPEPA